MILNFHTITFTFSILFWTSIFLRSYFYPIKRSDNKIAIINNLQCILLTNITYFFFTNDFGDDWKPVYGLQMFYKWSIDRHNAINIFLGLTSYLSLGYNLIDLYIQLFYGKWIYVVHHLSLLPFLTGYIYSGYFFKLGVVYGLLEISSLSYNLRQIIPSWDKGHKILYSIIRIITTPLLIKYYLHEVQHLNFLFCFSAGVSVFLLTIFNFVSIKMSIMSLIKNN